MKYNNLTAVLMACAVFQLSAQAPSKGASAPKFGSGNVISLFSDGYTNKNVDTWRTSWSNATLKDTTIASDNMKWYSNLDFVGIEATGSNLIDASGMNFFHIDFWSSNATTFRVKLVDFGADKAYGGGDDTEHEVVYTNPAQNEWVQWHIPLSNFTNLKGKTSIAQIIFSAVPAGSANIYVDNVLFTTEAQTTGPEAPTAGAETPTVNSSNVISLFSNAYTNANVDTWRTSWSNATLTDTTIASDNMKRYSKLDFVGIETTGANLVNASSMNYFHIDFWTNNATTIRVKLVDFGADKAYGGGDDTEHEIVSNSHPTGEWVSWHLPFSAFTNLKNRGSIAQIIFSAVPAGNANVFVDNVFFTTESSKNPMYGPTTASPVPSLPASQVISLFSNAYTNKNVDTWRTPWSSASFNDTVIASDNMKHYGNLDFVGVETTGSNLVDASAMSHFNFDFWTVNATTVRAKIVDFGADGAYGGGDDTEHEIVSTTHPLKQWYSWKIPFTDLTGLKNRSKIAQIIFSALPTGKADIYIDNVYFSTNQSSKVSAVNATSFRIFPNPAAQTIKITTSKAESLKKVEIIDVTGRVAMNVNTPGETIDISKLKSGFYQVRCTLDSGVSTETLVVE